MRDKIKSPVISKITGKPVDPKRSRAAKKAAATRKLRLAAARTKSNLRVHHILFGTGAILAVFVFLFIGIHNQLQTYAATNATNVIVGLGDKCLDNGGATLKNNNKVQLYDCNGTIAQKWIFASDGSLKAHNGSNYCLDVPGNSKAEFVYVQLYSCNGTTAQKFKIQNNALVSTTTGFCATVHYAETKNGTGIWMKKCHTSDAQKWTYTNPTSTSTGTGSSTTTPSTGSSTGSASTTTPSTGSGSSSNGGSSTTPPANYDFASIIKNLTVNTNLSLMTGTYSVNDFGYIGGTGIYSTKITGISGTGIGKTIIQVKPGTSTKASSVPTASGTTNPFYILRQNGKAQLSNFTLQGTDQGHLYNGMILYGSTDGQINNVKVSAIPGNKNFPPGETFSINEYKGVNNTYNNVEVDGAGVGASAFGSNSSSGGVWNNSNAHNNPYSIGWAFWQHTNGATINNSTSINNRGGVNFERATGTYYLNNMTFGGNLSDIAGGQDQDGDFKVIIKDPILLNGQTKLRVNWFATEAGSPNKYGKSNIQVIVKGVDKTSTMIQWVNAGRG